MILNRLSSKIKLIQLCGEWRTKNSHNNTTIEKIFDISRVTVGRGTYGVVNPYFYASPYCELRIGAYCSIAEGTRFVYGEHDFSRATTFPIKAYVCGEPEDEQNEQPIVVEDDVWIGMNCIILSGVTIHQGAVIGAGTVVAKDIPPYSIYAGGRIIGYRFDDYTIQKLLKLDYSQIQYEDMAVNESILYNHVDENFFTSDFYLNHLK